jgi:hypothetical protein
MGMSIKTNPDSNKTTIITSLGSLSFFPEEWDLLVKALQGLAAAPEKVSNKEEFPHYFKELPAGTTHVDIYMVLALFDVTDQAIGHAVKKLMCPGQRGDKSKMQDLEEAVKTLKRGLDVMKVIEALKESQQNHSLPSS